MNRRLPALLAVAVLVGAPVTGCGGDDDGDASAEQVVQESAEATGAVESFHLTFDSRDVPRSGSGLQLLGAEGDVSVPDRIKADVSGTFAGVPLTTQLVAIGDDVWIENPLGEGWQSIDVDTTPAFLLDPVEGVTGVMGRVEDLSDEGTEEVGGVETRKLSGTVASADVAPLLAVSPGGESVDATLWVGEEDRILRRIEVKGAVAENEPDDALRVIEISRIDEPVTVERPAGAG
jgi:lipoprotein LprG